MPLPAGTFFESMIFLFFRWDISDRSVGGYAKQSATNPGYILPSLKWNWGEHSPSLALKPVDMKAHRNTQMYKYTQIIHIYSSTGENGYIGKQIYIYINEYIYIHICTTIDANAIVQLHLISAMSISFYLHQKSHLLVDALPVQQNPPAMIIHGNLKTPLPLLPIPSGVLGPTANGLLTLFLGGVAWHGGTLGFRWTDDHGGDKAWYFKQVPQIWMQLAGFQY